MNNSTISKDEYNKRSVWGLATSIDLFGCDGEILRSKEKINQYVIELCDLIDMKRYLDPVIVHFGDDPKVSGYSMTQLIETSLVSGHFAEGDNSVYLDIFSCKYYDQQEAVEFAKNFFKAQQVVFSVVVRGNFQ